MSDATNTVEFPIGLNLKAENPTEQKVLEYLNEQASAELTAKVNEGKKTLAGAMKYAKDEARKMMKDQKNATSGGIMVDDVTVFGWIIHFFEEDSIEEAKPRPKVKTPGKAKTKPTPTPKASTKPLVADLIGKKKVKRQRVRPF